MLPFLPTRAVILLVGLGSAALIPGCSWFGPAPPPSAGGIALVGGNARVLSVDRDLGCVVVETDHGRRTAFWNQFTEFVRGDRRVRNPAFRPGDQFVYHGFEGDNEIYLRRVLITTQ